MPRKRCLIKSCKNHKGNFIFHVPELHVVGPEVRKKWLEVIDNARIHQIRKSPPGPYGICQTHFTSDSFIPASKDSRGRLLKTLVLYPNAIPTLDIGNASLKEVDPLEVDPLASVQEPACLLEYEDQDYFIEEEKPKIDELKVEILINSSQTSEVLSLENVSKQEMDNEKEIELKNENSFENVMDNSDDGSNSINVKDENLLSDVETLYKCEYCEKTFSQARNIKRHIMVVHDGRKDFKCGDCQQSFGSKQVLERHCQALGHKIESMIYVKSEEIANMYVSDGTTSNIIKADNSIESEGPNSKRRPNQKNKGTPKKCKYCGKTFRNLKLHIQKVHEGLDFKCGDCQESFGTLVSLLKHCKSFGHAYSNQTSTEAFGLENMYNPVDGITNNVKVENPWDVESFYEFRYFNCPSCSNRYTFLQDFVNHANDTHPESINYLRKISDESICNLVVPPWTFESESEKPSKINVKKSDVNNEFEVDNSEKTEFENPEIFQYNEKESKEEARHKCGLCGKSFIQMFALKSHIKGFHEGQIKCDICGKSVSYYASLKKHIYNKHKDLIAEHECGICANSFSEKEHLIEHFSLAHETDQGPRDHTCDTCGRIFSHEHGLKKHISLMHRENNEYMCETCAKSFSTPRNLKNHITIVHESDKIRNCDMCEESFNDLQKLHAHLREIHSKCHICGKEFGGGGPKAPGILRVHIEQVHEGKRNYCCDICGQDFYGFTDMKRHKKRHDNPNFKPGKGKQNRGTTCEICGKSFNHSKNLNNHLDKVHERKKNQTCELCGKSLKYGCLNRHIKQVHERQADNVCDICSKSFFGIGDLKRHIDSVHLKKPNVWKRKNKPKNNSSVMDQS